MKNLISILLLLFISTQFIGAQNATVEGYVFEDGNRGYLNQVLINIYEAETDKFMSTAKTNEEGIFKVDLPMNKSFVLKASKDVFEKKVQEFKTTNEEKVFLKVTMKRQEGYIFEVTLAPKRESEDIVVDAITGALIEVYNNTKKEEVLVLESHASPDFKIHFQKGNHYTVMVRKEGYLVKRMEAFVNVEGCILCFEGVGEVRPGVTDNLTEGLSMGTLLANVELDPIYEGKIIELQYIYYDFGKATLTKVAKEELKKLASIMKNNPLIIVELGSHTDVRGTGPDNRALSDKRAESAVGFLTQELKVDEDRIIAKGYGESLIKNKCKAGITCTDEEHAENRRTEIKILKIKDDGLPMASLASIIFEEEFMKKVLGGGVEQVNYKDNKKVEPEPVKIKQEDKVKVAPVTLKKEAKVSAAKKALDKKSKVQLAPPNKDEFKTNSAEKESKVEEVEKNNSNYSGYRIVVYFSSIPLSGDHEIYTRFDNIETFRTAQKNFLYMTGDFKKQTEAELFREENIEKEYPSSYVVAFLRGKKLKIE